MTRTELTPEQLHAWNTDGFLLLPGFYSDAEVEGQVRTYREAWETRPRSVVVDDLTTGRRCAIGDLSARERRHPFFKVNDLYLEYDLVRRTVMSERLVPVLKGLLSDQSPVLCNTLNLLRGSQQGYHVDAMYMTPRTPGNLLATWMALEDGHPDAGPLTYYPGSHLIPLYRFSDGRFTEIRAERAPSRQYYDEEVARRGLKPQSFLPKRGDLFLWHSNLYHGGLPVNDASRTRNSLVSHFYVDTDCRPTDGELVPLHGAYWLKRAPQAIPATPSFLARNVPERFRIPLKNAVAALRRGLGGERRQTNS